MAGLASRSPELASRRDSGLLVVDMQQKLLPAIPHADRLVWNIGRLLDGAAALDVPAHGTEQYPAGLGPTVPLLAARLPSLSEKRRFSCCGCDAMPSDWPARGIHRMIVAGIEAHVCVLQTVADLLAEGYRVYVVADAIASRSPRDAEIALRRMDAYGASLVTTEMILFEWCETAAAPEFKTISRLVREPGPEPSQGASA
ncbi:MAG: hydrolase [Planctomycetes bacterium]|nr:hydrolase [Planctomycetota bacterium]